MDADQVEQMLYEHAIRTKIRAPLSQRVTNLGYNRIVSGGVVAGAALVCTLAMTSASPVGSQKINLKGASARPQMSDTDPSNRPIYHAPANVDAPATAELALSRAQ